MSNSVHLYVKKEKSEKEDLTLEIGSTLVSKSVQRYRTLTDFNLSKNINKVTNMLHLNFL